MVTEAVRKYFIARPSRINKANAYGEVLITDSCKYKKVQGERGTTAGSPRTFVQAILSELTLQQVRDLQNEVHVVVLVTNARTQRPRELWTEVRDRSV